MARAGHLIQGPGHAPNAPVLPIQRHTLVHPPRVIQRSVLLEDVVIPGQIRSVSIRVRDECYDEYLREWTMSRNVSLETSDLAQRVQSILTSEGAHLKTIHKFKCTEI